MEDHFKQRTELLAIYGSLQDQPSPVIGVQERAGLGEQARPLQDETFQIAFVGRFSVGKSMLINRLFLNDDVLTVALKPTTARLMYIGYGEQPALWLLTADSDGSTKRQLLSESGPDVADIAGAIKMHTTHFGSVQGEEAGVYRLDWPDGRFFRDGVQLVDTVGTEDIDDRFIDATYAAIRESDAVVMILNMAQPFTDSEKCFIDQHLARTGKKVFLVLNRADAREPEEQDVVLQDLRQRFRHLYQDNKVRAEDRVFVASARTGQGLDDLRERLVQFVANERLVEMLHRHRADLAGQLNRWIALCGERFADTQSKRAGDENQLRERRAQLHNLQQRLEDERSRIQELQGHLREELKHHVRDLKDQGEQKLRTFELQPASTQIMATDLKELYERGVEELIDRMQREVRRELQRRVASLSETDLKRHRGFDGMVADDGQQTIFNAGPAVGGSAVLAGGTAVAIALQGALATPIPWWAAVLGSGGSTLTVFMGALAPWALPAIAGGAILAWFTGKAVADRERKRIGEFLVQARSTLKERCSSLEQNLGAHFDNQVEHVWQEMEDKVTEERTVLEHLIAETDLTALESQMAELQTEEERFKGVLLRLQDLGRSGA